MAELAAKKAAARLFNLTLDTPMDTDELLGEVHDNNPKDSETDFEGDDEPQDWEDTSDILAPNGGGGGDDGGVEEMTLVDGQPTFVVTGPCWGPDGRRLDHGSGNTETAMSCVL